jgi:DEAD/DEAH box helicase
MLLFLIAEATADSNELAARIDASQASPIQFTLIEALKGLAKGDLVAINATPLPPTDTIADDGVGNAAVLALYFRLLVGVRSLASGLLAVDGAEPDLAIQVFRDVQQLSSAVAPADGWLGNEVGAFAGPHHLACLLIAVAGDLAGSAVTAVNPPGGVDSEKWLKSMKRIATRRPYLWRNHRDAIEAGYLEPHNSAAVSFPTGAGKSTLAELKVSATLLSNKKVVFLAPTNALVGQTTGAMRKAFSDATVSQEKFEEQSFLAEGDELPEIFVMTPESCLAQMSFAADVFDGVGLLVFDECRLLHGGDENAR